MMPPGAVSQDRGEGKQAAMKLPFKAAAAFIASPQGRRAIQRAREKYDTPENRERAKDAFNELRSRFEKRREATAAKPKVGPNTRRA
jgi:hypothetical protein